MPWSRNSYERTIEAYKELLGDIIPNKRKSIDLIAREQLIRGSLLKYDFTKRQYSILMFIMTFSFNQSKEWAYIPLLKDFSIGGVSFKKIRHELNQLIDFGVIEENQDEKLYRIREPEYWTCSKNEMYDDNRSRELFLMNLQHGGVNIAPIIEKLREMDGK